MEWMLLPYRRYADFSGRSRRKEYWMFILFTLIVYVVLFAMMFAGGLALAGTGETPGPLFWLGGGLLGIFALGSFIPALAVIVRRFHDQDKSGWMILIQLIPYVGPIVVLVFMCLEGTRGANRFGPDPKDPNSADVFA
jgi:hypothetical protein